MQKMQNNEFIIASGNWTATGNFSGYTTRGKRVHIFGHQMRSAGFDETHVAYPFIVIAEEKSYPPRLDEKGNPIGQAVENRLTATAVFANEDKYADIIAVEEGFAARIQRKVAKKVEALEFDLNSVIA